MIATAAQIAGDSEVADRARVARDSIEQFTKRGPTTGLPSLQTILGDGVCKRLRTWFGSGGDAFPLTEAGEAESFAAHYGDRVRFDHRRGRWLVMDAGLWVPDRSSS